MLRRLKCQLGETMVETLVSILISALAMTVLATVIGTSVNIVMQSKDHMNEFYKEESNMVKSTSPKTKKIVIGVPLEEHEAQLDVDVYTDASNEEIIYYKRHEGE